MSSVLTQDESTDYIDRFLHFVQLVEVYVSDIPNMLLESMVESENIRVTPGVFEINVPRWRE